MLSVLYTTCSQVEVKKAENSSKPMGGKSGYPQGRQYASCCVWLCVCVCVCVQVMELVGCTVGATLTLVAILR